MNRPINKRLALGQSLMKVIEYSKSQDFSISKPTLINHKRHITDPRTTVVDQARRNPAIKRVTTSEFLQTLVDIGASKAAANADAVTIDQSIRAAQVLESRKERSVDVLLVIARSLAPKELGAPGEMIEGTYRELTTSEAT